MPESTIPFRRPDLLRLDYDTYRALPAVAKSESTPRMPILAKMAVRAAKRADNRA